MAGNPNKLMEVQKDIKVKAEDYRDFLDDLKTWESDIKKKDTGVAKRNKIEEDYPPIRGTVDEAEVLKMQAEKEKEDPIMKQKDLGNEFYKKGKYAEAVKNYEKGIALNPADQNVHVLHANKAMALLKLSKWAEAEAEASLCVQNNRTYTKGFFRRALARNGQGNKTDAIGDLNTVLVLEPTNKEAKKLLAQLQEEVKAEEKAKARQAETKTVSRKKLQIMEVDDDDEGDDEEEEVEIPIKKKPAPAPESVPVAAPTPAPAAAPVRVEEAPKPRAPKVTKSGLEILDDDEEEERGKVLTGKEKPKVEMPKHVDPTPPCAEQAPQPTAPEPATKRSSPKKADTKGVFRARDVAVKAAAEFAEKRTQEVPSTFLHFERVWVEDLKTQDEKAAYLRLVPYEKYPEFFRSNVTEDVLGGVILVLHDNVAVSGDAEDVKRTYRILKQLSQLTRLSALLMFLEAEVTDKLQALPALIRGKNGIPPKGDLAKVQKDLLGRLAE
eukprot:TRINITY_DN12514_c0_g1_i1.p1 TRINITY_DN12514_c0_g1~~TRINITY_DN12514_c0_g1_i1.p1  ORF type:complete len:496 (+),score=206.03 TRINITY_DN12514_c0_g1_i1:58-1545(+)